MNLVLQKILWPTIHVCTQKRLYFTLDDAFYSEEQIEFKPGAVAGFATYFNSFSMEKWREYTVVEQVALCLYILCNQCIVRNMTKRR